MIHTLFLLTFILFFGFAQASEQSCISVFGARQFPGTIAEDSLGKSHFQFGLEIEYTLGDSQALLRHYMPDPEFFPMSKDEWMGMSFVEKLEFIQANEKSIFPDYRNEGLFVRTHEDPGYNYLPESFLLDGKNFELRLGPMDSYEEFIHATEYITKRAGIGSMQANTSVSHKSFFAGENSAELNLGYFKAIQEHDTFEKIIKGYQRLQSNPDILAAKSFNHK
ncbi:MAG: hypothetical protein KC478_07135, partial [Bacteriovoracaceae bacterium]|nr:hypothetical protein [Bacteriovoracaceae bacterium]